MLYLPLAFGVLAMMPSVPALAASGAVEPIPSYQEAVESFQTQQKKAGGPVLSSEDRALMEQSARDLAEACRSPVSRLAVGPRTFHCPTPSADRCAYRTCWRGARWC